MNDKKHLIVITGPTGSGKTELALSVAEHLGTEIISADSRQIYREIPIGTAAPTAEEQKRVKHHLTGILELEEYYSAARFEKDAERIARKIWETNDYAIVCGGSMMYVDALCNGIDELPDISEKIRHESYGIMEKGGIEAVRETLKAVDPEYYKKADLNNHKRMIHAIEVSREAGRPYSSLLTGRRAKRDYEIVKIAINHDREILFDRINRRVEKMIACGMEAEAARVYDRRHLNSLNTVGFKELFMVIEGKMDRATAIARIGKNTRVYAKKQLTWLKKDSSVNFVSGEKALEETLKIIGI